MPYSYNLKVDDIDLAKTFLVAYSRYLQDHIHSSDVRVSTKLSVLSHINAIDSWLAALNEPVPEGEVTATIPTSPVLFLGTLDAVTLTMYRSGTVEAINNPSGADDEFTLRKRSIENMAAEAGVNLKVYSR